MSSPPVSRGASGAMSGADLIAMVEDPITHTTILDPAELPCGCFFSVYRLQEYFRQYEDMPPHMGCRHVEHAAITPELIQELQADPALVKALKTLMGESVYLEQWTREISLKYPAPAAEPAASAPAAAAPQLRRRRATHASGSGDGEGPRAATGEHQESTDALLARLRGQMASLREQAADARVDTAGVRSRTVAQARQQVQMIDRAVFYLLLLVGVYVVVNYSYLLWPGNWR